MSNDKKSKIVHLNVNSATAAYAKRNGAEFKKERGWFFVGDDVPVELEEFIVSEPRIRSHNAVVKCPKCGSQMKLTPTRSGGVFWSCLLFPKCRGARSAEDVDSEAKHISDFDVLKTTPQKLNKLESAKPNNSNDDKMIAAKIAEVASKKLGSVTAVNKWFNTPKLALSGKRPSDLDLTDMAEKKRILQMLLAL